MLSPSCSSDDGIAPCVFSNTLVRSRNRYFETGVSLRCAGLALFARRVLHSVLMGHPPALLSFSWVERHIATFEKVENDNRKNEVVVQFVQAIEEMDALEILNQPPHIIASCFMLITVELLGRKLSLNLRHCLRATYCLVSRLTSGYKEKAFSQPATKLQSTRIEDERVSTSCKESGFSVEAIMWDAACSAYIQSQTGPSSLPKSYASSYLASDVTTAKQAKWVVQAQQNAERLAQVCVLLIGNYLEQRVTVVARDQEIIDANWDIRPAAFENRVFIKLDSVRRQFRCFDPLIKVLEALALLLRVVLQLQLFTSSSPVATCCLSFWLFVAQTVKAEFTRLFFTTLRLLAIGATAACFVSTPLPLLEADVTAVKTSNCAGSLKTGNLEKWLGFEKPLLVIQKRIQDVQEESLFFISMIMLNASLREIIQDIRDVFASFPTLPQTFSSLLFSQKPSVCNERKEKKSVEWFRNQFQTVDAMLSALLATLEPIHSGTDRDDVPDVLGVGRDVCLKPLTLAGLKPTIIEKREDILTYSVCKSGNGAGSRRPRTTSSVASPCVEAEVPELHTATEQQAHSAENKNQMEAKTLLDSPRSSVITAFDSDFFSFIKKKRTASPCFCRQSKLVELNFTYHGEKQQNASPSFFETADLVEHPSSEREELSSCSSAETVKNAQHDFGLQEKRRSVQCEEGEYVSYGKEYTPHPPFPNAMASTLSQTVIVSTFSCNPRLPDVENHDLQQQVPALREPESLCSTAPFCKHTLKRVSSGGAAEAGGVETSGLLLPLEKETVCYLKENERPSEVHRPDSNKIAPEGPRIGWNDESLLAQENDGGLKKSFTLESPEGLRQARYDWEVPHSEITLVRKIGSGGSSKVYCGYWKGTEVAVKKRRGCLSLGDATRDEKFQREIHILLKLRHPNITLLMGAGIRTKPYFVLTEYCPGGDLFTLLHVPHKSPHRIARLTGRQKLKIAVDVAKGMIYLHRAQPQIIHRDLKSLNILLLNVLRDKMDEPHAKITDFGLSQLRSETTRDAVYHTTAVGTFHWMAPEILLGQPYNESVDVYSYGILLYELFSETIPYAGSDTPSYSDSDPVVCEGTDVAQEGIKLSCGDSPKRFVHLALAITQGHRPNLGYIPRHCPPALLSLMASCWAPDASQRPSFEQILDTLLRVTQRLSAGLHSAVI